MTTHQKLLELINSGCFEIKTVAQLVGISQVALYGYVKSPGTHSRAEALIEKFLKTDGRKLQEIQYQLRNGAKNRIELHRRRSEILKKVKVRQTTNHREPSVINS